LGDSLRHHNHDKICALFFRACGVVLSIACEQAAMQSGFFSLSLWKHEVPPCKCLLKRLPTSSVG
jgi:hypothetical protein